MKNSWIKSVFIASAAFLLYCSAFAADQTHSTNPATSSVSTANSATQTNSGMLFMQENKNKPGVVALPSGLQYKIVEEGHGPKPTASDTVTVDYEGTLLNGKVFDSSYQRGQPATFPVGGVIKGWQEALQLMPVGSTWMLYIPSDLAYGSTGAGGLIGPNETLVFKVKLISIN